jgi:histidinol-phosphate aminotransferase
VLIRQTGPQGWLRVTVGTPEENGMFRQALIEATGRENEEGPQ